VHTKSLPKYYAIRKLRSPGPKPSRGSMTGLVPNKPRSSFNPIPPIAGAATSMGHSNDLDTSGGFPKDDEVGKSLKHHPARAECVFGRLPGVTPNSLDRAVKLIHKHFRSPHATQAVPFRGYFGFLQCGRVNSNGCGAHRSSRNRRRRRASSQGMSSTAPLSIC
jgi:hypothetical protein